MGMIRMLAEDLTPQDRQNLVLWLMVLMGVVVVGFGAIMLIRRMLRSPGTGTGEDTGFSLSELRAMRDRGEITSEEYEQTRSRVIAKVKGSLEKKPENPPPPNAAD